MMDSEEAKPKYEMSYLRHAECTSCRRTLTDMGTRPRANDASTFVSMGPAPVAVHTAKNAESTLSASFARLRNAEPDFRQQSSE